MPAIPANTLLEEAKCYTCLGVSLSDALRLALLARISSGEGLSVEWGEIGGTLANQTDLQTVLTSLQTQVNQRPIASYQAFNVNTSVAGTGAFETLASFTIPGGAMGANGFVTVTTIWTFTSNANNKQVRTVFGGSAIADAQQLSVASAFHQCRIVNQNNAAVQAAQGPFQIVSFGSSGLVNSTLAVNTAVDVTLTVQGLKAVGGDAVTLRSAIVETVYIP